MPSSADRTAPRPDGAGLDCALFADGVRMHRLLGPSDPHKPGESAGPASAMGLDMPIRCLATVPRLAARAPAPGRQPFQSSTDPAGESTRRQFLRTIEAWAAAHGVWLTTLAGFTLALGVFGLVARARGRNTLQRGTRGKAHEYPWF